MYTFEKVKIKKGAFFLSVDYLRLEKGGTYAVIGPNGCGKSTFLDILMLLNEPSGGRMEFSGKEIDFSDEPDLIKSRRRISCQMQNPWLFDMTVYENVISGLKIRGGLKKETLHKADVIIEKLQLTKLKQCRSSLISGGEAQRTALARALVLDADVYVLDEPTAGVDSENAAVVETLIRELNQDKDVTIVLATHSKAQAERLADEALIIKDGLVKYLKPALPRGNKKGI